MKLYEQGLGLAMTKQNGHGTSCLGRVWYVPFYDVVGDAAVPNISAHAVKLRVRIDQTCQTRQTCQNCQTRQTRRTLSSGGIYLFEQEPLPLHQ